MPINSAVLRRGISFLEVDFSAYTLEEVVAEIVKRRGMQPFFYVVTPNVHHCVMINGTDDGAALEAFRDAYRAADLRLCDSRILARLARLCGLHLPIAPGSDLTAALFRTAFKQGDRVAIVGGHPDAVTRLNAIFSGLVYVQHIPPFGMLTNPDAMREAAEFVIETKADYTLFAIGAPQGEILAHQCAQTGAAQGVGVSIGASIDFLIGDQVRAPRWMQRAGLEWAHRLAANPKRMWRRYLVEGPRIFLITWRWARKRGGSAKQVI